MVAPDQRILERYPQHERTLVLLDWLTFALLLFLPNLTLLHLFSQGPSLPWLAMLAVWLSADLLWVRLLLSMRRQLIRPLYTIVVHALQIAGSSRPDGTSLEGRIRFEQLAGDLGQIARELSDQRRRHAQTYEALQQARQAIAMLTEQNNAIIISASREMMAQYHAVLGYAGYVEEQQTGARQEASLDDLDEVSESAFNLKLIASALQWLQNPTPPRVQRVTLAELLQDMMLSLVPSLDRRAMTLTSADIAYEVCAAADPDQLQHALWMVLLGVVRYAASESSLRLRCCYSHDATRALMSVVVSELSPAQVSEQERAAYLARKARQADAHLFAETIRVHANLQLAQMMLATNGGTISVVPLTHLSCEICISLPIG